MKFANTRRAPSCWSGSFLSSVWSGRLLKNSSQWLPSCCVNMRSLELLCRWAFHNPERLFSIRGHSVTIWSLFAYYLSYSFSNSGLTFVSSPRLFLHSKKLPKRTWWACSKTQICAPSTRSESPSCQRTFSWLDVFEESGLNELPAVQWKRVTQPSICVVVCMLFHMHHLFLTSAR